MNLTRISLATALLAALFGFAWLRAEALGQPVYDGCPMQGNAKSRRVEQLDRMKNRDTEPTREQIDPAITLQAILAPGEDEHRWKDSEGATVEGYVAEVKPGGVETVNCGARNLADRDTHIVIAIDPAHAAADEDVIVEVTPRWRGRMAAHGVDWSTHTLEHELRKHWVRVSGWMFWDAEHWAQSEHTAPGRAGDWRATAWEIHPVTRIDVLPGKPR